MKHAILILIPLFGLSLPLAYAGEGPGPGKPPPAETVFTRYNDWRFHPTERPATNRCTRPHHADLTVPLHGPWLLNPAYRSITVCWVTRIPCCVALDYRKKGDVPFTRIWKKTYGALDYSSDIHHFHLEDLEPGTEYEYRLVTTLEEYVTPSTGVFEGREIHAFKTLDPKRENYRVFLTSDLHGNARGLLAPMLETTGSTNALLYFFLGDNVQDYMSDGRCSVLHGFLDDVSYHWGKRTATVFLRGNHDARGREAYMWRDFFPRPDGKSYQAFSAGPVLFICLDTMDWGAGSLANRQATREYYEEQARWIEGLKKTPAWKKARFRVVMAHYATHGCEGNVLPAMQEYFKPVLNETSPRRRIHLFLAGHEHFYARFDPDSARSKAGEVGSWTPGFPNDHHYAEVICNLCEGMTIDVTRDKLTVRSHCYGVYPGTGLRDAFEVLPDGSVRDLMEVESFACPRKAAR